VFSFFLYRFPYHHCPVSRNFHISDLTASCISLLRDLSSTLNIQPSEPGDQACTVHPTKMTATQQQQQRRRPLSARKLDVLYLVFFVIHIPIMLCEFKLLLLVGRSRFIRSLSSPARITLSPSTYFMHGIEGLQQTKPLAQFNFKMTARSWW
jgi:hypothetical protein